MKIVVFGGTGLVGQILIEHLLDGDHDVVCVSKTKQHPNVPTFNIDICKKEEFNFISFIPEVVLNCSSLVPQVNKSSLQPDFVSDLFEVNVVGGLNIANWAVKHKSKLLINYSTLVTVKKPWPIDMNEECTSLPVGFHVGYCMSKLSQEQVMSNAILSSKTKIIHLRLSAVFGDRMPKKGLIYNFIEQLRSGDEIKLTNGNNVFLNFIHTDDIARITMELLKVVVISGRYNCASRTEVSLLELVEILKKLLCSNCIIGNTDQNTEVQRASINNNKLIDLLDENFTYEYVTLESRLSDIIESYTR